MKVKSLVEMAFQKHGMKIFIFLFNSCFISLFANVLYSCLFPDLYLFGSHTWIPSCVVHIGLLFVPIHHSHSESIKFLESFLGCCVVCVAMDILKREEAARGDSWQRNMCRVTWSIFKEGTIFRWNLISVALKVKKTSWAWAKWKASGHEHNAEAEWFRTMAIKREVGHQ